jgi:hypothetical protein
MAVDPTKPRTVLVIHGVQTGDSTELKQHELIAQLLQSRVGNMPLKFTTDLFRYEDLNDQAQNEYQKLIKLIVATPVGQTLASKAIDLIGDVVTARLDTSTAAKIRQGFKEKIMDIFEAGNPCYIVAHSLGSIYAFDVINELMAEKEWFDRQSRRTWPVQGLITLGSPIGLSLFNKGRKKVQPLGEGEKMFRWVNYWDRTDPVVSGQIFGRNLTGYEIAEKYRTPSIKQGWVIRDRPVDTGKVWLMAHVAYWGNPMVGDGLFDMVTN